MTTTPVQIASARGSALASGEAFLADVLDIQIGAAASMGLADLELAAVEGSTQEARLFVPFRGDDGLIRSTVAFVAFARIPHVGILLGEEVSPDLFRATAKGGLEIGNELDPDNTRAKARLMALKVVLNGLVHFDGGKAKVVVPPGLSKLELERLLQALAHALVEAGMVGPRVYVPATDLQTYPYMMQILQKVFAESFTDAPHATVTGTGILPGHSLCTGRIAALALDMSLRQIGIHEGSVAIQGYGKVGHPGAVRISELGHRVVAISDVSACYWNPHGVELAEVDAYLAAKPGALLSGFAGQGQMFPPERLLTLEKVQGLMLAAGPGALDGNNAGLVAARALSVPANGGITRLGARVFEARGGVGHYDLTAGGGGVRASGLEWELGLGGCLGGTVDDPPDAERVFERIEGDYTAIRGAVDEARARYPGLTGLEAEYAAALLRILERAGLR